MLRNASAIVTSSASASFWYFAYFSNACGRELF